MRTVNDFRGSRYSQTNEDWKREVYAHYIRAYTEEMVQFVRRRVAAVYGLKHMPVSCAHVPNLPVSKPACNSCPPMPCTLPLPGTRTCKEQNIYPMPLKPVQSPKASCTDALQAYIGRLYTKDHPRYVKGGHGIVPYNPDMCHSDTKAWEQELLRAGCTTDDLVWHCQYVSQSDASDAAKRGCSKWYRDPLCCSNHICNGPVKQWDDRNDSINGWYPDAPGGKWYNYSCSNGTECETSRPDDVRPAT